MLKKIYAFITNTTSMTLLCESIQCTTIETPAHCNTSIVRSCTDVQVFTGNLLLSVGQKQIYYILVIA